MPYKTRQFLIMLVKRYGWQEVCGTITAMLGALIAQQSTSNPITTAYAGTAGENVGFYGFAFVREIRLHRKDDISFLRIIWRTIRNLVLEFGPAEFFDSSLIRPACMLGAQKLFGNPLVGVFVGKIMADVVFYGIAGKSYELRKKLFGK
ncbi:MAG: hypothetical protein WCW66_04575 [Patescibacteria group bacterium]